MSIWSWCKERVDQNRMLGMMTGESSVLREEYEIKNSMFLFFFPLRITAYQKVIKE